jgi:hypothetical protein
MHGAPPSEAPCIIYRSASKQIQLVIRCIAWHTGCQTYGMIKINNRILQEIAFQIESGNAAWGLLFANEYLSADSWLHRALTAQFTSRTARPALSQQTAEKLLAGARAIQFSKEELREIGARAIPPRKPAVPTAAVRSITERHASRLRAGVRR